MKNIYLILIGALFICGKCICQIDSASLDRLSQTPTKSGLSYEALTQFYQATFTSGQNGGFKFKSSLFGIQKLFSSKDLDLSQYYLAKKGARNLELSLGVDKNKDNGLDNIRAGFKYAIVNNRSKSDVNFFNDKEVNSALKNINDIQGEGAAIYSRLINSIGDDTEKQIRWKEFVEAGKKFNKSQKRSDLPSELLSIVDSLSMLRLNKSGEDLFAAPQKAYDVRAKIVDTRGLWTVEFSPGYSWSKKRWDSTSVVMQYLKGFGNYERPWNFDGQLRNHFLRDTLGKAKNLSRSIAAIQIGLNKVLAIDNKKNPLIEFELAFEDNYVYDGLYKDEDEHNLSFNTILRVHISKEITVPLTLKYDLKNPNIFGFLQFTWNLENKAKSDSK